MLPETLSVDRFRIIWEPGPFVPRLEAGGDFAIVGGMGQRRPGQDPGFLYRGLLGIVERRGPGFVSAVRAIYAALKDSGWQVDDVVWENFLRMLEAERSVRTLVIEDFVTEGGAQDFLRRMREAQKTAMDYSPVGRDFLWPPRPVPAATQRVADVDKLFTEPRKRARVPARESSKKATKRPNRRRVVWDD